MILNGSRKICHIIPIIVDAIKITRLRANVVNQIAKCITPIIPKIKGKRIKTSATIKIIKLSPSSYAFGFSPTIIITKKAFNLIKDKR